MKTAIISLLFLSLSLFSNSQVLITNVFENIDENLLLTKVYEYDSLSANVLHQKIIEWAGITFRNQEKVLTSETTSQLVFDYISTSFYIKVLGSITNWEWNIRLIVSIKDNKIRLQFYDFKTVDGYYLKDYFKSNGELPKTFQDGLSNLLNDINATAESLNSHISKKVDAETW